MRKLIYLEHQEHIVKCDNPSCNKHIKNDKTKPIEQLMQFYINMPCPDCGENLLTQKDYESWVATMKAIKWLNKWFSWLTIFIPKNAKYTNASIHTHNDKTEFKVKDTKELK